VKERINLLREFSLPLIAGVAVALVWANLWPETYHEFNHKQLLGHLNFHFITNDIFMVFFFAIAAAEITESCLPGGDLHPLRKAASPLFATIGGVLGPVAVYFLLNGMFGSPELVKGWGIPTATDIAIAWLVAKLVFGASHPAVPFLLLLAIADDAIGLAIIAFFYPDPSHMPELSWLILVGAGMGVAWALRRARVRNYWPYLVVGGGASWTGLFNANLHPALALVFIVPFLPHPRREHRHLFEEDPEDISTLATFEHEWKVIVDFGLLFFGLANAGVEFSSFGTETWLVFDSLFFGKTVGIFLFAWAGERLGFSLPEGMGLRELLLVGIIAGIGFTVSLFIAGEAFMDPQLQNEARMGAILSVGFSVVAIVVAKLIGIKRRT